MLHLSFKGLACDCTATTRRRQPRTDWVFQIAYYFIDDPCHGEAPSLKIFIKLRHVRALVVLRLARGALGFPRIVRPQLTARGLTMSQNPLTLTRQTLYELVWSKPMSELAKDFNISDVGLAKRCRAVDVPIPYRGYWARKIAGQTPPKLPLPKYRSKPPTQVTREGPEPEVGFTMPAERIERGSAQSDSEAIDERAFEVRLGALKLAPAVTLADTCAAVRRTARHERHPQRAWLPFARSERSGPIVNLSVTAAALDRALLFADRMIRTAAALGSPLQDPPPVPPKKPDPPRFRWETPAPMPKPGPVMARLLVDGVEVEFRIEERMRRVNLDVSPPLKKRNQYNQSPPPYRMEATGALRLVCLSPHFYCDTGHRSWYDQGRSLIEDKIPKILWRFQQLATRTLREKAEAEEDRRQQQERERIEHELSVRRGNHAKLIEELERQAGVWLRTQLLRRYLRALRRTIGEGRIQGILGEDRVDFLLWAEQYADQLDPLSSTPRNSDQQRDRSPYWNSGEQELKNLLSRLLSCERSPPWKLTGDLSANCADESEDDEEFET
jgi:hypothetical protein